MKPFRDERGFTTTSMVISLLVTLSLVFTAAQVYRVNSASAEVQDVADAAALAAENQVAEFMVIARFCDAIVLTLTLTGTVATGLGIAALCTPVTAALSEGLIDAGKHLFEMRNRFADKAAKVLNKLQEALPYLSAACAAGVSAANNGDSAGSNYLGVAVLVPSKGEEITVGSSDRLGQLLDDVDAQAEDIREKARRAEEAAEEANRCKERAFARDCGDNPGYCMYERASRLAGLSGGDNPLYANIDTWSFSVALARAQAYYAARERNEAPADGSIAEQARSALRSRFYRFAVEELADGYVHETTDSFEANFPHLPSNTTEMRATALYTDQVYPITVMGDDDGGAGDASQDGGDSGGGELVMHAWMGCPEVQAHGVESFGSIAYMEDAHLATCPTCGFTAASMGKVAAASTSVENGFEYHYEAVADEAFLYEKARREAEGPKGEVKEKAGALFDELLEALKEDLGKRIEASPPGRYGAVAFVVNAGNTSVAGGFANTFVADAGSLGPRAAVGAATLVDEGSSEGRSVLNSVLDGLRANGGAAVGAAGIVLDAWSWMLGAYAEGQDALVSGVRDCLDAVPLVGSSGLGTWASRKLESAIEEVGLQPAEIGALKAVLVNSGHVASKGEESFASGYMAVKKRTIAYPASSTDLFSSVLTSAEAAAVQSVEGMAGSVEIASIELLGEGGPAVPVTIPLPAAATSFAVSEIHNLFGRLRSFYVETTGVRTWE